MKLAELQQDFRAWLVTGSPEAAARFGNGSAAGLAVYQNNYRASLVGCLEVSYPQVRAFIGDEAFLDASITHIDRRPPHAWTLDAYGEDFIDTLTERFPRNPDVHELAWIEWSLSEAFVAPDAPPISTAALVDMDWDQARLALLPSLRSRSATTNAEAIWIALQQGNKAPEGEMLDAPAGLIVWRAGLTCRLRQVDAVELTALRALRDDDRFAGLCDTLVNRLGEEQGIARSGALLAEWLGAGIVVDVSY
jgi:hypothetical protein